VISEYKKKSVLVPQDVIKCCLKLHQIETGEPYYDCREKLWRMRPGDVVFTKGTFQPLMSYARIDDTLKGIRCGHMEEDADLGNKKKKPVACSCRKWYVYYKTDGGKVKKTYPQWDGMTMIARSKILDVVKELGGHSNGEELESHFSKCYMTESEHCALMKEIQMFQRLKR